MGGQQYSNGNSVGEISEKKKFILMQSTKEKKYSSLEEKVLIILEPNKQRFDGPIAIFLINSNFG